MIRWQSNSNHYNFTNTRIDVTQRKSTDLSLCIPLVSSYHEVERLTRADTRQVVATGTVSAEFSVALTTSRVENLAEMTSFRNTAQIPRLVYDCVPGGSGELVVSPVMEGLKTGATNATTGALVGLGLCFFFGPAGAAYALWAACGAGAVGVTTGAAQAVECKKSNDMRVFVELCDEFLQEAQARNLDDQCTQMFRLLCQEAKSFERQRLVRQILDVCRILRGREAVAGLEQAKRGSPAMDAPPPYTPREHRPGFDGTNWSAQGAIHAAHAAAHHGGGGHAGRG